MKPRGRRGATRPWQWLAAIALSLLSGAAMALGLGQIRVLSAPGEPLLAEIPIVSNAPGELENARARLASPETFARVGLQPPAGLVRDLQFEIAADAHGRAVVRVTTQAPVDVPAVAFLIEMDWGQGRLVREYSALIAAPRTAQAIDAPVIEAPQAMPSDAIQRDDPVPSAPQASETPLQPGPQAAAEALPAPPAAAPSPGEARDDPGEVRVERGQTLSQLALSMDRDGHSLNQTMLALLHANPQAFIDGNIHRLRSGAVLRRPDAAAFARLDAAAASAMVREQTRQWRQAMAPVPQPADPSAGTAASPADAAPGAPAAAGGEARLEIAPAAAAAGAQATESGLGAGGEGDMLANERLRQAQEDLASRDSELQELRSRVEELEKLQQQQMKLIELKDSELAAAQQRLAQVQSAPGDAAEGVSGAWWWGGGLVLAVLAAAVWWLARRPKPLPIPSAVAAPRSSGWDATALAAAMPAAPSGPAAAEDDDQDESDESGREDGHGRGWPDAVRTAVAEDERSRIPGWHGADAAAALGPLNPAPAGRERLELAIAYLDLGDVDTARTLLHEVAAGQDPAARDEAAQLLREIG